MPYLELYTGQRVTYFSMTENSYIGILKGQHVIFPQTCAEIDYSEEVNTLIERMNLIDYLKFKNHEKN